MAVALIEQEVRRFLLSSSPEVLCISGDWGGGKTFIWKHLIKRTERDDSIPAEKYSYVSLFGIQSLDDVKYAIWENTVPKGKFTEPPSDASFLELISDWRGPKRKITRYIGDIMVALGNGAPASIAKKHFFKWVKDQIVCIDDLERRGEDLNIRDLMGLASHLKEEKGCKVVLLLNDGRLGDDIEEFQRQLEKVIDVEIKFDPTPEYAASIALDCDLPNRDFVIEKLTKLNINNIRVIKKIERLYSQVHAILQGYDEAVALDMLSSVILFSWSRFQHDKVVPIEFIRSFNTLAMAMEERDGNQIGEEQKAWKELLSKYPYSHTDDVDLVILEGVEMGFFNEDHLKSLADKKQEEVRIHGRDTSFDKAWDLFHGSLTITEDELAAEFHKSAIENSKYISLMNINSTIVLLRELDHSDLADEIVSAFIAAHLEEPDFFDLGKHHILDRPLDKNLREAFESQWIAKEDNREPKAVLLEIHRSGTYGRSEVELLDNLTVKQFIHIFKNARVDELRPLIEAALTIGRHGGYQNSIFENVSEALRDISSESKLRARQLGRYDFDKGED